MPLHRTLFASDTGDVGTGLTSVLAAAVRRFSCPTLAASVSFTPAATLLTASLPALMPLGSDVHIACFQTVFTQSHFVADFDAVVVHNGIARGEAVGFEVRCGRHFVSGAAVGILLRLTTMLALPLSTLTWLFAAAALSCATFTASVSSSPAAMSVTLLPAVVQTVFGQAGQACLPCRCPRSIRCRSRTLSPTVTLSKETPPEVATVMFLPLRRLSF